MTQPEFELFLLNRKYLFEDVRHDLNLQAVALTHSQRDAIASSIAFEERLFLERFGQSEAKAIDLINAIRRWSRASAESQDRHSELDQLPIF